MPYVESVAVESQVTPDPYVIRLNFVSDSEMESANGSKTRSGSGKSPYSVGSWARELEVDHESNLAVYVPKSLVDDILRSSSSLGFFDLLNVFEGHGPKQSRNETRRWGPLFINFTICYKGECFLFF